jgi:trigger factor
MVAEVARRKALAAVLEKVTIVDADGNTIDLNELNEQPGLEHLVEDLADETGDEAEADEAAAGESTDESTDEAEGETEKA